MLKLATKLLTLSTFSVLLTLAIFSEQAEESFNLSSKNNKSVRIAHIEKIKESGIKAFAKNINGGFLAQ